MLNIFFQNPSDTVYVKHVYIHIKNNNNSHMLQHRVWCLLSITGYSTATVHVLRLIAITFCSAVYR